MLSYKNFNINDVDDSDGEYYIKFIDNEDFKNKKMNYNIILLPKSINDDEIELQLVRECLSYKVFNNKKYYISNEDYKYFKNIQYKNKKYYEILDDFITYIDKSFYVYSLNINEHNFDINKNCTYHSNLDKACDELKKHCEIYYDVPYKIEVTQLMPDNLDKSIKQTYLFEVIDVTNMQMLLYAIVKQIIVK